MTTDDLNRIRDKLGDQPGLPTSDDRWLVSVAVDVLGAAGSPVQDPAAYVARAIRNDPGRYRRTPKPDPVAEVLARSNGAGACEHGEPRGPDHCPLCRRRNR